ncbi:MAG: hypothetical protein ACHQ53_16435 [Polyangiales bacterium]
MTRIELSMAVITVALLSPALGHAQDNASGQAGGSADIELGATQPSQVEMGAGSSSSSSSSSPSHNDGSYGSSSHVRTSSEPSPSHDPDGARIALQLRLDALNMLNFSAPNLQGLDAPTIGHRLLVPLVAPGVRFLEERLFLGLGLGLAGASQDTGGNNNMKQSRSGWSLTPTVTYDLLREQIAALSLIGMINMARLSESSACNNNACVDTRNAVFGWGLTLGAGVRGLISRGIALGGEFGWGFLSLSQEANGPSAFVHGLFGNLFLEGSVGI